MKKIDIDLTNCYGIKRLKTTFDFSEQGTFAVYSPNGTMKTSFSKTFMDYSLSKDSEDRVFRNRKAARNIKTEDGAELPKENVFVIEPYNEAFRSSRVSTLLVNKELKTQYDEIYRAIDQKKEALIKELKTCSGLSNGIEESLAEAVTHNPKEFFTSLVRLEKEVIDGTETPLGSLLYKRIFSEKTIAFIETKGFKEKLTQYIEIYDRLLTNSTYFKKGVFNHNNAATIAKNLKDNGFFQAAHSVSLNSKGKKREINNETELAAVIEEEKKSILEDNALRKSFDDIDKKIAANQDLRDFREYLEQNPIILPELANLNLFKQKLWVAYLKKCSSSFKALMETYNQGKKDVEKIIAKAKEERTKWQNVLAIFNDRFSVPFKAVVANQEDVILKRDAPSVAFTFNDANDEVSIEESLLPKILSNGESRAFYLLNIIFEVEARKAERHPTIFIVDDIADSFDYKNKYAIIEYLREISRFDGFNQIILTHNFDFFRTVSSRLGLQRKMKLHAIKSNDEIIIKEEKYQNNPFTTWKNNFSNAEMLIASIPFLRNLAEYCGDDEEYNKLTSLLHLKSDTDNILISDLENIIKQMLKDKTNVTLTDPSRKVKDVIYQTATAILAEENTDIELEKKILLSIAIRLKTEEFIITKIMEPKFVNNIKKNQTFTLIEKYKEKFPQNIENIRRIEQVHLMTPENIHLNSFMYEPILDMSNEHLKKLYGDISNLS
jgi:ABC-type dipeptide/oligopeptide/nickel transport system ATPase subunit